MDVLSLLCWRHASRSHEFCPNVGVDVLWLCALPMVQAMVWTPAAIFLTIHTPLVLLAALPLLVGGNIMDAQYEQKPWVKALFCDDLEGILNDADSSEKTHSYRRLSDADSSEKTHSYRRARELAVAAQLLGAGCCQLGAIISGGAQDMCLLAAFPLVMTGYSTGSSENLKVKRPPRSSPGSL